MVVNSIRLGAGLVLVLVMFSVSCSSNTPGGVVTQFYKSLNAGEYSTAKQLYTTEALQFIDAQLPGERFVQWADMETRKGTIQDIKITSADTRGEGSNVAFAIVYRDGATVDRTVPLRQENGSWKVGLIR